MDYATFFENTLQNFVFGFLAIAFVAASLVFLKRLITRKLTALDKISAHEFYKVLAKALSKTSIFFIVALSLYIGSLFIILTDTPKLILHSIILSIVMIQLGFWTMQFISYFVRVWKRKYDKREAVVQTWAHLIELTTKGLAWTFITLFLLKQFGFEVRTLVAGLGIAGIAVSLSLQNVLGDILASLSIAIDKPFMIGDFIIIGDLLGSVEHIGIKTTRIRSLSGEQLIFSNSELLKNPLKNYKRMQERRIAFEVQITYETPLKKIENVNSLIRQAIETTENTRLDRVHFKEFASYSLNFEAVYYVLSPDYNIYMDTQESINFKIFEAFEREGIEFAYPTAKQIRVSTN